MNLLSTKNNYYRYKVEKSTDICDVTYTRRLKKSLQNNKTSFFFELSKSFEPTYALTEFLLSKARDHDIILTRIYNHELLCKSIKEKINPNQFILNISNPHELLLLNQTSNYTNILFTPVTNNDLKHFVDFQKNNSGKHQIFWSFVPYSRNVKNSLTVRNINKYNVEYKKICGLEIFNSNIPLHYELEPIRDVSYKVNWTFSLCNSELLISVIIPTYNNVQFLCNVVWHLINQSSLKQNYEIIIVDDGSKDHSSDMVFQLFEKYKNQVNIKYIYWSKTHPTLGEQQFFRPGLARNLGSRYSAGKYLIFLDSDMLVPENFINTCMASLQTNDFIQFQRFHINQDLSKKNPIYKNIDKTNDTYIEEKNYWSDLFFSDNWSNLPNYWKYTCTYALGLSKENFLKLGMFKKYYISYGFEDTDLGYEAYQKKLRFKLIKTPLFHLTSYDKMQYQNSANKRFKLLCVTAELFYLQHLDKNIYHLLGNYYRLQKPVKSFLRDMFF